MKNQYFAQTKKLGPEHRSKYFKTLEEGIEFVEKRGGGLVKKRRGGVVHDPEIGRIEVWGIVYDSEEENR